MFVASGHLWMDSKDVYPSTAVLIQPNDSNTRFMFFSKPQRKVSLAQWQIR